MRRNCLTLPRQWNKPDVHNLFSHDGTVGFFLHEHQGLHLKPPADGDAHYPARLELAHEGRRDVIRSGSDDNGVEGRMFFPTVVAVSNLYRQVFISESLQPFFLLFDPIFQLSQLCKRGRPTPPKPPLDTPTPCQFRAPCAPSWVSEARS